MSPRGVAIPEVRRQLFDAAERVLLRDGPSRLSGRAITREAGVATGLLYNHFSDLNEFLTEFVVDRARLAGQKVAQLPGRAGSGTVAANMYDSAVSLFGANMPAFTQLVLSRPAIVSRLTQAIAEGSWELHASELAFTAYLDAEKALGRITADADTRALSVAFVGAAHQLLLTHGPDGPDLRDLMRRVALALIAGITPDNSR